MERIEFIYHYEDENGDEKRVITSKSNEHGLSSDAVNEMYLDFMSSVGYSEDNVLSYFHD